MGFFDVPLTQLIDQKMSYVGQRQSVLAQNVANVDTPNYKAKDLQAPDFRKMLDASISELTMTRTNSAHLNGVPHNNSAYAIIAQETTSETKPNGNNVSVEEEMKKMAMNGMDYQMVIGLSRSVDKLYDIALGKPDKTSS